MKPKSNCCGVDIVDDYHFNNELCPSCGEHCEIEDKPVEEDNWMVKALYKVMEPNNTKNKNNEHSINAR